MLASSPLQSSSGTSSSLFIVVGGRRSSRGTFGFGRGVRLGLRSAMVWHFLVFLAVLGVFRDFGDFGDSGVFGCLRRRSAVLRFAPRDLHKNRLFEKSRNSSPCHLFNPYRLWRNKRPLRRAKRASTCERSEPSERNARSVRMARWKNGLVSSKFTFESISGHSATSPTRWIHRFPPSTPSERVFETSKK